MLRASFCVSTIMKNEELVIPHLKVIRYDAQASQDKFQNFQKIINLSRNCSASLSLHRMQASTFNVPGLECIISFNCSFRVISLIKKFFNSGNEHVLMHSTFVRFLSILDKFLRLQTRLIILITRGFAYSLIRKYFLFTCYFKQRYLVKLRLDSNILNN